MRHNPRHAVTDAAVVRRLIAENPWATIVSKNAGELVASPGLLDDSAAADELTVVTHVGRAYQHAELADEMERALRGGSGAAR